MRELFIVKDYYNIPERPPPLSVRYSAGGSNE
jgi:hypothetical protein